LLIELLRLEVRLPPQQQATLKDGNKDGGENSAPGVFCEVAPAWDRFWGGEVGDYYCTTVGNVDMDGRAIWDTDGGKKFRSFSFASNSALSLTAPGEEPPEPLVAFLVAVPPPGGIAHIAYRHLGVAVHSARTHDPPFRGGEVEVSLRPLLTAPPNSVTVLESSGEDNGVSVNILATWFGAPSGLRDICGLTTTTTAPHCDNSFVAGPPPQGGGGEMSPHGRCGQRDGDAGRRRSSANSNRAETASDSGSSSAPSSWNSATLIGLPDEEEPPEPNCADNAVEASPARARQMKQSNSRSPSRTPDASRRFRNHRGLRHVPNFGLGQTIQSACGTPHRPCQVRAALAAPRNIDKRMRERSQERRLRSMTVW